MQTYEIVFELLTTGRQQRKYFVDEIQQGAKPIAPGKDKIRDQLYHVYV